MSKQQFTDLDKYSIKEIDAMMDIAGRIEAKSIKTASDMENKILCPLFFQDSSRTFTNSCTAFLRMGGTILPINTSKTRIGGTWNEPVRDFCELLNTTCDYVVIRLQKAEQLDEYCRYLHRPFINAGNGIGVGSEHPLQALTDLYTIKNTELLAIPKILMIGGQHVRTTRSQLKLFVRYGFSVDMVAPSCGIPNYDVEKIISENVTEYGDIREVKLSKYNLIYHNGMDEDVNVQTDIRFNISASFLTERGFEGKVMHSLPRLTEMSTDLDETPFNLYFEQMYRSQYVFQSVFRFLANQNLKKEG